MNCLKILLIALLCVSVARAAPTDTTCDTCTYLVGAIESWIESNSTVQEITQLLDTLCDNVPGWTVVCDAIVSYGIADLIQLIESTENPTTVCTQLGLCSSTRKVGDTNCFICEQVIGAIEGWIDSSSTISDIETSLDTLCSLVPGFVATCDAIVEAGVPTVVNWIVTYENATVVCTQLQLCGSEKVKVSKPADDPNCDICRTLIFAIEGWMADNKTETTIENDLEKYFCTFAGPFTTVCDSIAVVGVPTLVNWIETNENPTVVCQQLGLCAVSRNNHHQVPNKFGLNIN